MKRHITGDQDLQRIFSGPPRRPQPLRQREWAKHVHLHHQTVHQTTGAALQQTSQRPAAAAANAASASRDLAQLDSGPCCVQKATLSASSHVKRRPGTLSTRCEAGYEMTQCLTWGMPATPAAVCQGCRPMKLAPALLTRACSGEQPSCFWNASANAATELRSPRSIGGAALTDPLRAQHKATRQDLQNVWMRGQVADPCRENRLDNESSDGRKCTDKMAHWTSIGCGRYPQRLLQGCCPAYLAPSVPHPVTASATPAAVRSVM